MLRRMRRSSERFAQRMGTADRLRHQDQALIGTLY